MKVVYDPETVNLSLLLDLYFKTIDPTSLNRQGNDRGTQYRTGIYYTNKADIAVINQAVRALADQYKNPIAIEVKPLTNFYPAENYHQDYLDKNPNGYCHINPALFEMARKANAPKSKVYQKPDDTVLRQQLSAEQYAVTQNPEGDFSEGEVEKAIEQGFTPISLGKSRLRTETAALVACHTLTSRTRIPGRV